MAERGLSVDHSTVYRWVVHFAPKLLRRFNKRKHSVTSKWHIDETYIGSRPSCPNRPYSLASAFSLSKSKRSIAATQSAG